MIYEKLMTAVLGNDANSADTNVTPTMERRTFLKISVASGFALGAFSSLAQEKPAGEAALKPQEQPNAFIQIDVNGQITVQVNRLDFGQGVSTTLPMLVAEELDADWANVTSALAPGAPAYVDTGFGIQMTGGSNSVKNSWRQYRELGARTRSMLIAAAAKQWQVPAANLRTELGYVINPALPSQRLSYGALAQSAAQQPVPDKVMLKQAKDFKIIGKPTLSTTGAAKARGQQMYGIDVRLPNMKTVVLARPPVFGAKLSKLDASRAKAVKGVQDVFEVKLDRDASGVAIIADGYWPAKLGRDALQAQWDTSTVEKVDSARQLAQYRTLASQPGAVAMKAASVFDPKAALKIEAEFVFPYLAHAPMEPLNCVFEQKNVGDQNQCHVYVGSQFQTVDQGAIAQALGLKPSQVVIHTQYAGGGFGRRAVPTSDYLVEAATVFRQWQNKGRTEPLRLMWSREDDIKGGYYRPMTLHRAKVHFDATGQVLGWDHTIVSQSIISGTPFEAFMVKNGVDNTTTEGMRTPYQVPMNLQVHHPKMNVPVLWWRSVGSTHTAFVMETLIDEIATASGQDPVALRKRLWADHKEAHRFNAALDLAVSKSGYGKTKLPDGHAWGVAVHESFQSVVAFVAQVSLQDGQPKVHQLTAGVHCNTAVNPLNVIAQVQGAAAMAVSTTLAGNEITLKDGVVEQSNFGDYAVARMPAMPKVQVHIAPSAEPPTGMGEPGLPPVAPAIANALAKLTGQRQRQLPFKLA